MIEISVPGSKSWINRFLLLAVLSEGQSQVNNWNSCEDCMLMLESLKSFGHELNIETNTVTVTPGSWRSATINAGEAGSVARFLMPIAAWLGNSEIKLAPTLARRPFDEGLEAIHRLGGEVSFKGNSFKFGKPIKGSTYLVNAEKTTQFLSGFEMLAAAIGSTISLTEKNDSPYSLLTRELIKKFGGSWQEKDRVRSFSGGLFGQNLDAEVDLSGAVALLVALILSRKSGIILNWPCETFQAEGALLTVLADSGLDVELNQKGLKVKGRKRDFNFLDVEVRAFPDAIPALVPLALTGNSSSIFRGADYLKSKESDRLENLMTFGELTKTKIYLKGQDLVVEPGAPKSCELNGEGDHRMVMAAFLFKMLNRDIDIIGTESLKKSFPNFENEWKKIL